MYVQYGSGRDAPGDWINFDASPTARFESIPVIGMLYTKNRQRFPKNIRYGDVTRGLPVSDQSCDGVYCSHVLEHLSYYDCLKALKETFRILRPGGVFRLVVPDLECLAREYLSGLESGNLSSSHDFMMSTFLGVKARKRTLMSFLSQWVGNSHHLWMWDYLSLSEQLMLIGFINIRRASFNDCEDIRFRSVENQNRFIKACAIEARRP